MYPVLNGLFGVVFFKVLACPEIRHKVPLPRDTPMPGFNMARRVPHEVWSDSAANDFARGDCAERHDCAAFHDFSARVFLLLPSFLLLLPHTFSL